MHSCALFLLFPVPFSFVSHFLKSKKPFRNFASHFESKSETPFVSPVVSVLTPNIPTMYELHFVVPIAAVVLNSINSHLDVRTISILHSPKPLENPVKILTVGALPSAPVLLRIESLKFVVSHEYGLTETGGLTVSCAWKREWNKFPATERARLKARQGVRTLGMTEADVVDLESRASVKRHELTLGVAAGLTRRCVYKLLLEDQAFRKLHIIEAGDQ